MIIHDAANRVVKLQIGGETCAVRMPRMDDSQLQVDRKSELAALNAAATLDLTAELLSFDAPSGVMITRWIDQPVWTPEQARDPEHIGLIAAALRRLHALDGPAGVRVFNMEERLRFYMRELTFRGDTLPRDFAARHREALELARAQPQFVPRLCHNDLHCRNLIGAGEHFRILDWEYAGLGNPLFDLASYAQSNGLDGNQIGQLLDVYGADAAMKARYPEQERLFEWICSLWMQVTEQGHPSRQ